MPKIKKRDTSAWIRKVAASHGRKVGEIGYMFVDDEKILEVNNEYLGHDYYTDVITFDYDEDDVINGDIVISLDTAADGMPESRRIHWNFWSIGKNSSGFHSARSPSIFAEPRRAVSSGLPVPAFDSSIGFHIGQLPDAVC